MRKGGGWLQALSQSGLRITVLEAWREEWCYITAGVHHDLRLNLFFVFILKRVGVLIRLPLHVLSCRHYFSGLDWAVCRLFLYCGDAISFQLDIFYFLIEVGCSHWTIFTCETVTHIYHMCVSLFCVY